MEIREYLVKDYLHKRYLEMNNHKNSIKYNAIRNAFVDLSIVSESKIEKWEESFKNEVKKNV